MADRVYEQLKRLGIRDAPSRSENIQSELFALRNFQARLWGLKQHQDLVAFVRRTISPELSRKLEHIITPPQAMGLAEEVSLDSLKWFVEYWWKAAKKYSPDLYVAQDNTVVASWWTKRRLVQVRFFSSGYALASIKHPGRDREEASHFWMSARELPSSFIW